MVKRAARRGGVERPKHVTPHCLRKAFESALRNNGVDPKDQEFLMGHILPGSQDPYYDRSKIESLRQKYMKIRFFPSTDVQEFRKKQILDTVRLLDLPEERIKLIQEALAKYETVDDAIREIKKLSSPSYKTTSNKDRDPKKIINEDQLEDHLAGGWNVQNILPSGRILINRID